MLPSTTDDPLFDNLSPADLLRYSRTSKAAYEAVSSYMRRTFNLQNVMGRYFTEHELSSFRFWQSQTGMLISGSTALQFFDRTLYPDSDLDIYVEHRYCQAIAFWLVSIGYTYESRPGPQADRVIDESLEVALSVTRTAAPEVKTTKFLVSSSTEYLNSGVARVYNFYKSEPDRKIQLITSHYSPLEVILRFHSTCVMNLISHEKAYCLYARDTLEEHRSLVVRGGEKTSNEEGARAKYVERGWKMVDAPTQDESVDTSAFSAGSRYVGDSKCWTITIFPDLQLPKGYIETNSWNLAYNKANNAEMLFTILMSPTLRYSYLVKGSDVALERYIFAALFAFEYDDNYADDVVRHRLKLSRGIQ